jgi:hypothetical protein
MTPISSACLANGGALDRSQLTNTGRPSRQLRQPGCDFWWPQVFAALDRSAGGDT